jgi:hypothetical protein
MFTGSKPAAVVPDGAAIRSSRSVLAVVVVAVLVAALAWVVMRAPAVQAFDPFN